MLLSLLPLFSKNQWNHNLGWGLKEKVTQVLPAISRQVASALASFTSSPSDAGDKTNVWKITKMLARRDRRTLDTEKSS